MTPLVPPSKRSVFRVWSGRRSLVTTSPGSLFCLLSELSKAIFVLCLIGSSLAQRDPVEDFCRRFGHQTALIDRKLYIDGGFVNFNPMTQNPTNYTNTWLSYQDLDHPGSAGMPQLSASLSKNASIPTVDGGILWADDVNKKFYLFGGEYYQDPPNDLALYAYDVLEDNWEVLDEPPQSIDAVSYGAGVSISATGEAYYYGGWLSNNSVPGWTGDRMATNGLVKYTMDDMTWSNNTGPDATRRAEGVMVYIPASDGGMLVYFGGLRDMGNGSVVGQPMEEIFVYDILSGRWYQQSATGDVPEMRSRFCAGVTWAADQSSYNIYLYGGLGMPPSTAGFDDVYILSLPSFTWIKFYPGANATDQYPHNTLSCNVVDGAQMVIVGGSFPLDDTTCDAPDQWGSHNLDLGKQNPEHVPWHLYDADVTSYAVPEEILAVVGGGPQGGATRTSPDAGFDEQDLSVLMGRQFTASTRTPTRAVPGPSSSDAPPNDGATPVLSNGGIAGIAVGAAVALIAALVGCIWFIRRHRRTQSEKNTALMQQQQQQQQQQNNPFGPEAGGSPWSIYNSSPYQHTPVSPYAAPAFPGQQGGHHHAPVVIPGQPAELYGDHAATGPYAVSPQTADVGGVLNNNKHDGGSWPLGVHPALTQQQQQQIGDDVVVPSPITTAPVGAETGMGDGRYASAGFGPSELDTDPSTTTATTVTTGPQQQQHPMTTPRSPEERDPRHETFYHQ